MSQEPLEAAPSRRALRARQADAATADVPEPVVPDVTAPRPSRRELRAMERSAGEADAFADAPDEAAAWGEPGGAPAAGLSGRAASLWSAPAEQWAGRAEQWVEQTGSWAVQPEPVVWAEDPQPVAWAEDPQPVAWSEDPQPVAWTTPDLEPEEWAAPERARAEQWADDAQPAQWSVPEPAQAERWQESERWQEPEHWQESEPEAEEPVESGSLIMPAGHLGTGPVTPAQPYGRPAVFLDAPVQPALPPIDLDLDPEPVRARVSLAEPPVLPVPRLAPAAEGPHPGPARGSSDDVALRALALAEASSLAATAFPTGTSAREEELADPLGELTLAERLASLPVAPWAVDLELIEGGYVEHPCEPVDSVPQPHEPVGDRVPPEPTTRMPERPRDLSGGSSREPAARAAVEPAGPTAPVERRAASAGSSAPAAPSSPASFRPEGATHRVADSALRPSADTPRGTTAERPLPRANDHIPSVGAWVPPDTSVDPLTAMRRQPGPPLATWGAWLGVAAAVAWFLGPIALGIGVWTMNVARQHDYSRARPLTAIVGGVLGTLMGVAFVIAWH